MIWHRTIYDCLCVEAKIIDDGKETFQTLVTYSVVPCGHCTPTGPYLRGRALVGETVRDLSQQYYDNLKKFITVAPKAAIFYDWDSTFAKLQGRRHIPMHSYWRHN